MSAASIRSSTLAQTKGRGRETTAPAATAPAAPCRRSRRTQTSARRKRCQRSGPPALELATASAPPGVPHAFTRQVQRWRHALDGKGLNLRLQRQRQRTAPAWPAPPPQPFGHPTAHRPSNQQEAQGRVAQQVGNTSKRRPVRRGSAPKTRVNALFAPPSLQTGTGWQHHQRRVRQRHRARQRRACAPASPSEGFDDHQTHHGHQQQQTAPR